MRKNLKSLSQFSLGGIDGEIGNVKELYLDDQTWEIRYWVVETGSWLQKRKVLIATQSLASLDWQNQILQTNLTLDQIKSSPDIDTDKPVSRQQEIKLYEHFPWRIYWGPGMGSKGGLMPLTESVKAALANDPQYHQQYVDPHLRSSDKITGYQIQATDGPAGHLVDLILETDNWEITYLLVEIGSWLSSHKVLLPVKTVIDINWSRSEVRVGLSTQEINDMPDFDTSGL